MSAITSTPSARGQMSQQLRERRFVDQAGRLLLAGILILTVVIYLIAPIQALRWIQLPFMNTFIEYPATVNLAVTRPFVEGDPLIGTNFDLRQGDTILAINETPVNSGQDLYRELRSYAPGDTVRLEVLNDNGQQRTTQIILQANPQGDVFGLFAITYFTGMVYLVIGLWVYRNRRDHIVGRSFLFTCASVAILFGTTFDLWTTHTFTRIWTAAFPIAAASLVVFAMVFPSEIPLISRHPVTRWIPLIPAAALVAIGQFALSGTHPQILAWWRIQYIVAGIGILLFMALFLARGIFAAAPTVREQARVVFGGALLSFAPFILWAFQVFEAPIGWLILAFILFPVVIAYSIVQYNVLDSGKLISFTTTYGIMGIATIVTFALMVAGISMLTTAALTDVMTKPWLIGGLVFVLVLVFQPARERIQTLIDRLFFRSETRYEDRLTTFRHNLTVASNLGDIVRLLKQQVREAIMPTHTYVFLRNAETGDFIAVGEGSRPDTDIRFDAQSGLVHALSTTRDVIFLELNTPLPPELVDEHARLAILRTPVLAPLQGQDRLAGWLAVGNRRSGERFEIDDLRFIQALAEQASLGVERAQVIGDLERRVRELDVLSQVSQAVNFATDPEVLMELIYTQAGKLVDSTNFYIILNDEFRDAMQYGFFVEGGERVIEREGEAWRFGEGLASEIVRTSRPIRTDDYLSECRRRNIQPRPDRHYAWMGVPLNAGTRTLGVMVVASYTQGVVFTDDQLKFFWAIADQAATALDKARLFRETEERNRQLATLNELSKELSSTLDLENLLAQVMRSAVEMINTEAGSLFLVEETSGSLVFRVVEGGAQDLLGTKVPSGKGIVGQAADTGQPVIVNDVLKDPNWFSDVDRETEFQTKSLLTVPLLVQDETVGVLQLINKRDRTPFSDDDVNLLTTFAAQAAIAVENARLYEATDAELAARIDELQYLLRIDRELNRTLQLEGVIAVTLKWAKSITGAAAGAIAMLDPEGNGLTILAADGYQNEWVENHKVEPLPINEGIAGRVITTGKPEFIEDVSDDPDFIQTAEETTVSEIVVPILRANKPIGVLALESHIANLLTSQDFEFAQRLVEHAAVAIENARLLQEVEQANRDKTEFISFVAHELKNPMTSIRGYTDLLKGGQMGEINDMQVQFLGTIRSNVDRMTRLVSDLSDMARIETGHMRLEMSPIGIKSAFDETLRGLQAQIEEKEQDLIVEIPEDLPQIYADHTRIVQVLTNLVSNAHKYTPESGQIQIGSEIVEEVDENTGVKREMIHSWVKDTGIGMAEEELEQLFTKFFRSQRAKDMAQGTGLGLNITRSLIENHGGRIWVESAVGEGTIFHFTVPTINNGDIDLEQAAD